MTRVLKPVLTPDAAGVRDLRLVSRRMGRRLRGMVHKMDLSDVVEVYRGTHKYAKYKAAYETICSEGLSAVSRRDADVEAFIKAEKFLGAPKDPRVIQGRKPVYNLELTSYLRPIEKALYGLKNVPGLTRCTSGTPLVVKALNLRQRAQVLRDKMSALDDPVVLGLDGARWDLHVDERVLEVEHGGYLAAHHDARLRRLLSWQLVNKCRTMRGMRYKVRGRRMSGDPNTALGNCWLMLCVVIASMRRLRISKYEIMDDGDDCLVIVERRHLSRVVKAFNSGLTHPFGFEMKVEGVWDTYHEVLHCQGRPTLTNFGWTMARNPRKAVRTAFASWRNYGDAGVVPYKVLRATGLSHLHVHKGVPILEALGRSLVRLTDHVTKFGLEEVSRWDADLAYLWSREGLTDSTGGALEVTHISDAVRTMYVETWGVSLEEQKRLENYFDGLRLSDLTVGDNLKDLEPELIWADGWIDLTTDHCDW